MGQYLIAPRRQRRRRSLAMLVGSVTRAADRVCQTRYAVDKRGDFFDNSRQTGIARPHFGISRPHY